MRAVEIKRTSNTPAETGSRQRVEEAILVDRAQAGDDNAFSILVSRYRNRIFNFAYRYTRSEAEAEDLTQEVFLRAFRNIKKFRGDSKFSTWLFQIAKNLSLNHLASWSRKMRVHFKDEGDDDGSWSSMDDLPSPEENSEQKLERQELAEQLNGAIQALSPQFRMALILRDVDGMSYEEIADVMKLPPGTVKSRIHRARCDVQARLTPYLNAGAMS